MQMENAGATLERPPVYMVCNKLENFKRLLFGTGRFKRIVQDNAFFHILHILSVSSDLYPFTVKAGTCCKEQPSGYLWFPDVAVAA